MHAYTQSLHQIQTKKITSTTFSHFNGDFLRIIDAFAFSYRFRIVAIWSRFLQSQDARLINTVSLKANSVSTSTFRLLLLMLITTIKTITTPSRTVSTSLLILKLIIHHHISHNCQKKHKHLPYVLQYNCVIIQSFYA